MCENEPTFTYKHHITVPVSFNRLKDIRILCDLAIIASLRAMEHRTVTRALMKTHRSLGISLRKIGIVPFLGITDGGAENGLLRLKVLFRSIQAYGPPQTGRRTGSGVGLIRGPFSLQTDRSDARSWMTLEQSMGPNRCFQKRHDSLLITLKESQFTIQFFHYRLPLCPVQRCAVS